MAELKTEIWVQALVRTAQVGGAFATVARRGDRDAGAVLLKVSTLDGRARLYAPAQDGEGARIWLDLSAGTLGDRESDIDAYASKRRASDPDLWVVEIEDREGRTFLSDPIDRRASPGG